MPATVTRSGVRSAFVGEVLKEDPRANAAAVNEAGRAAGRPGEISAGLVNHLRSRLGLSGNLRAKKVNGMKGGRRSGRGHTATNGSTQAPSRRSLNELAELEVAIDRLLMKVVGIGQLPEDETELRKARRQLYAATASA